MSNRDNELDVSRALAAYLLLCHLYTTTVADDATVADTLVLAAGALKVFCRTEDALAEEAVTLWFICAVVDGLWFCDLTVRVLEYFFRRSDTNGYLGEIVLYLCIFLESHSFLWFFAFNKLAL